MNKWLRFAAKIAFLNKTEGKNFSLGAVLVKGGSIISTGTNKKKTDPIIKLLSSRVYCDTHKFRTWMHAELDCINRIPYEVSKNTVLFVARITHDNKLANAKPCSICQREIKKAGIRKVHYTLDSNREVILYLSDDEQEEFISENSDSRRSNSWQKETSVFSLSCH